MAAFVAELRRLSEHCDFGTTLDVMIRDRLVCGVHDPRVQRRLLAEPTLTFKDAFKIVQSMELASKDLDALHQPSESPVNKIKTGPSGKNQGRSTSCYRCGGKHREASCRFKDAECFKCGKRGHIARVCRGTPRRQVEQTPQGPDQANCLDDEGEEVEEEAYAIFNLPTKKKPSASLKPLRVTVLADGLTLELEVDTGASVSIINEKVYHDTWPAAVRPSLQMSKACLRTYTGEKLKVVGEITVSVSYRQQLQQLSLLVVRGQGPTLLGRDWLKYLKLDWNQLLFHRVHAVTMGSNLDTSNPKLQQVLERHAAVFKEELGTIVGQSAVINVKPDAQPVFCRARQVPYALKKRWLRNWNDCRVRELYRQ